MFRSRSIPFETGLKRLIEWERRHAVSALGCGSPWTLHNAEVYAHYEHEERNRYFAGMLTSEERAAALCREDVEAYIRTLNEASGGATFHYLDNETPKQRYGHMWHVGFELQVPAWHDYDQDRRASYCDLDPITDPNPLDPRGAHYRRTYSEIVARQRAAGALSVWAHPTSWWFTGDRFTTNIASAMPANLYADGFLDGITVQGYDAFHRDYQALWFELLDRGWRASGFSELDLCPGCGGNNCPPLLNCIPGQTSPPSMAEIQEAFRAGRHTMSSGPYLALSVDGVVQGGCIASQAGAVHRAVVEAWPAPGEKVLSHVQIIGRGGKVLADARDFCGGEIEFAIEGDAGGGWLLARALGEHDGDYASKRQQEICQCAITNPVRLVSPHSPAPEAVTTRVTLKNDKGGTGTVKLLSAAGDEIWCRPLADDGLRFEASPTARLVIERDGAPLPRILPLAAANLKVRELMDYLADGIFLRDFEGLEPGQVPVAAFHLDDFAAALAEQELEA